MKTEDITTLNQKAISAKHVHPQLRMGQALMNVLYEMDRNAYCHIMNTSSDPFYNDSKLEEFYTTLTDFLSANKTNE